MAARGKKKERASGADARVRRAVARVDWERVASELDAHGFARLPRLVSARDCAALAALYDRDDAFRKTISMEQHRFGRGAYRYFRYPLPPLVAALRRALYPALARVANRWHEQLGDPRRFEGGLTAFTRRCHREGQARPTPLLLRYGPDGFNCLHQDLYGPLAFPLQVTVQLERPELDFRGGEFLLVEQRPRQQSRGAAVALGRGEAIVFPTRERPVEGARGFYRAAVRHGVSPLRAGRRTTLGVIFHDAR